MDSQRPPHLERNRHLSLLSHTHTVRLASNTERHPARIARARVLGTHKIWAGAPQTDPDELKRLTDSLDALYELKRNGVADAERREQILRRSRVETELAKLRHEAPVR